MSVKNFKFVSPGVFINEIDNTFRTPQPENIGPVVIGRSPKGLAMTPIKVENYRDFVDMFGETVPGRGGGDVYRDGNNQSPMYATYAAKAFLQSEVAPLTFMRLLGQQSVAPAPSAGTGGECGWQTSGQPGAPTSAPVGGGAYGLFVAPSGSITNTGGTSATGSFRLGAVFYCDDGAMLLSGTVMSTVDLAAKHATMTQAAVTAAVGTFIDSDSNGNFKLKYTKLVAGVDTNDETFSINFDDGSRNFIRRQVNTNPTLLVSGTFYPAAAEKNYWLGESYEQFIRDNGSTTGASIGIIMPLGSASANTAATAPTIGPQKMKGVAGGSVEAKAGWFIGQDTTPGTGTFRPEKAEKLFRLKGRGHGEWLHKNAKVQIDRVRGPASLDEDYGSFSVIIRALGDTDHNPQVLERFDNLNLDPTSPQYIAKVIGNVYHEWDEGNKRLRRYGDYENQSKYVYVELAEEVEAGASNPALVPFGFFGPPKYPSVIVTGSTAVAVDKNCPPRVIMGALCTAPGKFSHGGAGNGVDTGMSGGIGKDGRMRATFEFPTAALVAADTDTGLTNRSDVIFGMRSGRTATSTGQPATGLGDVHRMLFAGIADDPSTLGKANRSGFRKVGVAATRTQAVVTAGGGAVVANDTIEIKDGFTAGTVGSTLRLKFVAGSFPSPIAFADSDYDTSDTGTIGTDRVITLEIGVSGMGTADVRKDNLTQLIIAAVRGVPAAKQFKVTADAFSAGVFNVVLRATEAGQVGNIASITATEVGGGSAIDENFTGLTTGVAGKLTGGHDVGSAIGATGNGAFNQIVDGFGYIFTLDDVVSGSTSFTYTSGSRLAGTSYTAQATRDYRSMLDLGYDSFTAPFFGGFDGLDITKPDPLSNSQIGSDSSATSYEYHTYRQALETIADPELLDFNVLAVPGLTKESLTNYQMELCQERRDALAIIDLPNVYTPFAENVTATPLKTNERANRNIPGIVSALRARRIDNSYACTFFPWVQTRDRTGQTLWVPPSVAMLGVLGSSESKSDVWFAPAGFNRGGLSDGAAGIPVTNVSSRLSSKERDQLYEAHINPIASFPSSGIVVFGQKTLQMRPSALDRINVRRLVIFLKKQISILSTQVLFEQNVQATWNRFKGLIEPFLANVKTRYGITEYRLILDDTTTTPDLIDQNILYAKIMVKPARAIEFIAIDFIIANTGASFDD